MATTTTAAGAEEVDGGAEGGGEVAEGVCVETGRSPPDMMASNGGGT